MKKFLKWLTRYFPFRQAKRLWVSFPYVLLPLTSAIAWSFRRSEDSNFYYKVTERNQKHMAHAMSIITGAKVPDIQGYFEELLSSASARDAIVNFRSSSPGQKHSSFDFGRRLGWYALVRVLKPKMVLETGVHNGLGALALCLALEENSKEGHSGRYVGTDTNSKAGSLIGPLGFVFAEVKIGDSIRSINNFDFEVDFYVSDSDHSAGYEYLELLAAEKKLSKNAIIVSDNAHATDVLEEWSPGADRKFLFIPEKPAGHWYPGAGMGVSFT
jgi:hypothetical protein